MAMVKKLKGAGFRHSLGPGQDFWSGKVVRCCLFVFIFELNGEKGGFLV